MKIQKHQDLIVWQKAMDTAMLVFEITKTFPVEERYSLTDQMRRASRSVAAQISEAWRRRRYRAAFVNKMNEAEGEAAEMQTHIEIARRCHYLSDSTAADLDSAYEEIISMLVNMSSHLEKWCP
ncbi:four helix bundle protein [Caldilinea sp.]|jgi:four helix bundle protein|uniref:four helix bundle protein n=1 Tax=Caldilinea sp. TaxID=2293560 RepID=UPI0021DEB568|nr:four helix bundle protein [Caldilinea sp.]GIV75125.1 MAG: four helix bundle protein [Caldilinea sp.]